MPVHDRIETLAELDAAGGLGEGEADLRIESWQEVPLTRGLGSSSAAIVSGLFAANALLGFPADMPRLLDMATAMEGHPDNVAPALVGGMVIAVREAERPYAAPVPTLSRWAS